MSGQEAGFVVRMSKEHPEDSPWWVKDVASVLRPQTREMLEHYAHVPSEKVPGHIDAARKRAAQIAPYPSVGALTWLNPYILLHEAHETILERVKDGATIVDCGCFFAPDLRQLAYEGAPTENMYGFDINSDFFDIGFDFYNDRDRFHGTFFAADGTKELESSPLGDIKGKVDIIWCAKFLHLFDRPHQLEVAARLVALLKLQPGSMFVGSQNGFPEATEIHIADEAFKDQQRTAFTGNADTIKDMWNEVAEMTGTKWNVESRLLDMRTIGLHEDDGSEYKKMTGYNLQWIATLLEPPQR